MNRKYPILYSLLLVAFLANMALWFYARDKQAEWANVPPAPSVYGGAMMALGDTELAYRMAGVMLQNLGDVGGRTTALTDYNYERLGRWFTVADHWDPRSNFMPYLAAYYFGAVHDPAKLNPIIDYLETVGKRPEGDKWRWLAQAVFLARYTQKDTDKALKLANELATLYTDDKPYWVRQMPALILTARGEKQAAYDLMIEILRADADKMDPTEVAFIKWHICERILNKEEAAKNPLCTFDH